ncbi:hypothetical protein KFE25_002149 [Diacronema lutheri]|uniref:Sulfhydryl oxidase n=1 Tax=Diacronema lutheri TaxID=2081491 RepID=A0A8J5XKI9_DIALT|nr:hypothetical protein KFE25_002149 [Diacronema lutheri]
MRAKRTPLLLRAALCALPLVATAAEGETCAEAPRECAEAACKTSLTSAYFAAMLQRDAASKPPPVCPPDRYRLGRYSWTLLHSIAAYYPDSPTDEQQQAAAQFLRAFPLLYPCKDCAHDLQIAMASTPPRLGSRAEFSLWMCELHNHVNEQVGKAPVPCDLRALDEAWRTPSKECERAQAELAISAAQ